MYTCNSSTREVREEGHEFEREVNLSYMVRTCLLKNKKEKEEKEKIQTWIQMCRWQTIALGRMHTDMHTLVLPTLSEKRLPPPPRMKCADPDCVRIRTTLWRKGKGKVTTLEKAAAARTENWKALACSGCGMPSERTCVRASGSPSAVFLRTGLQKADSGSEPQKRWISENRSLRQTKQEQQQQNSKQSHKSQLDDGKTLIGCLICKWGKE